MEIFGMVLVYLQVIVLTQSVIAKRITTEVHINRSRRYGSFRMQHPAYSMMIGTPMSFPGHTMHSGMSSAQQECITDDIICPSWCLMEDEWGCKYCPCGPASGMTPAIMSEHKTAARKEDTHDCIGTILCMLSCKNGYKLGEPSHGGDCQSCTCVKSHGTSGHDTTSYHGLNATQSAGKGCQWPLCMNGATPNNGPGAGSEMTSLPVGGAGTSMGAGGSLPGVDCMGPACSAKNGMHMAPHSPSVRPPNPVTKSPQTPMIPTTAHSQHHVTLCPRTEICINSCKYHVELGPVGPDGCNMCRCVIPPTKSPSILLPLIPTPEPVRSCVRLEHCINTCTHGFKVESSRQNCPECKCINPTTPSPVTSTKPDIMRILKVCPDTVHCMKSCTQGYTLTTQPDGCPKCICNDEPKVVLLCEQPLSCPYGCTVGYKCDAVGCPTCNCIMPSEETKLLLDVQTTRIDSALTCSPKFSCTDKCVLGYKTGDNGCPSCICLQPVTYMDKVNTIEETLTESGHRIEVLPQNNLPLSQPDLTEPSGIGCFDSSCQSLHEIGNGNNMFISAIEHTHNIPQTMNTSGHALLVDHVMSPDSQRPNTHTEQVIIPANSNENYIKGSEIITNIHKVSSPQLSHQASNGGVAIPQNVGPDLQVPSLIPGSSGFVFPTPLPNSVESKSPIESCPEAVKCMVDCQGTYKLVQTDNDICPECQCTPTSCLGPACSAPGAHVPLVVKSTPAPGECLAILHCVMTCSGGYDIGVVGADGCLTCACVK